MKILKSWLKDYIEIKYSDSELAERLSLSGTAVEEYTTLIDERVVVAEIKKIEKHPNADRLQLADVFDGEKIYHVVCGAPNIAVGQKVPFAKIGTKLALMEIKPAEIRGIKSEGMLCAEDELGLGQDHAGIMQLSQDYVLGKPLAEYLDTDTLYDLEINANRGDCLSHIGVAREIAAFSEGLSVKKEPVTLHSTSDKSSDCVSVEIKDEKLCPEYYARVIKGVKIGPSPDWLVDRLAAIGQKPINNVVDITNYIMFDLGQPLHAFDYKKIIGKKIFIRKADKSETIETLDGKRYSLLPDTLVIADAKKPIAIAGVMGGANSEVTSETSDIILEAAEFSRPSIRKTVKKLNIASEASYRFEREIDSGGVEYAINKAAKLIAEVSGGNVLEGIVKAGERPAKQSVEINYKGVNTLLDLSLSDQEINHILKKLGFEIESGKAIIPLWRHDLTVWQDIAEEVGRIYGYDKITPLPVPKSEIKLTADYYKIEALKNILTDLSFVEVVNYAFLSESDVTTAKISSKDLLEVANPIQPENKYLRNSLIPHLIKDIAKNPTFDPVLIFETGHVFDKKSEENHLAIAASGKNAKSIIEEAKSKLQEIFKTKIVLSELSRAELERFKVRKPVVYYLEVSISNIAKLKLDEKILKLRIFRLPVIYRPGSKYPAVTRDLAFIIDKNVQPEEITKAIYEISDNINRVELFDEFVSDKLGAGKKSLAFHLYLENMDKTMTDAEAETIIKETIRKIEKQFSAKLR